MSNGTEIQRLIREVGHYYHDQIVKDMPITPQQGHVLQVVHQMPGIIQSDLAKMLHRRNPTISSIVSNLEKAELIERKVPKNNIRRKEIYLTPKGDKLYKDIMGKFKSFDEILVEHLDEHDQAELIRILKKIMDKK
ncbi:MarR family winged helix-turn-helix transcriptional regulator [Fructilactobacillus sp. Tb1]|uniref:MarR family winged helix-turn-helix transcriptional regulator n=1 Tax=Fructilactobacillus sp. Tb1 TaxID=3422304 RepID=UPI003D278986